jgi:integrase
MKLTDAKCRSAKPSEKAYKLADGGGMYLEIMPNGGKYWRYKYRLHGKEKKLCIGVYPEIPLTLARDQRDQARKQVKAGIDPSQDKQDKKNLGKLTAANTFEAIAREWHEHNKERWTPRHAVAILHRLDNDIFPALGSRPIASITPPQILTAMRTIEARGAHEVARRTMQYCGQVFRYAIQTGRIESDPTRDLKGALKPFKKGHYRALDSKDLPAFLRALDRNEARLYPQTINATRLLLLTFVRTSELIEARWDEFDFENNLWHIPAERMKMRQPHIVPLSRQTLAILEEQKELTGKWEWVFPNQARPKKPMSNGTILGGIRRMGYKDKTTGHGFRALAMSTIKEELGYRHEVIDRQLAHAPRNRVDAAYDRAMFLSERKKMMQEWADYLDSAANSHNVIQRKFGKAA